MKKFSLLLLLVVICSIIIGGCALPGSATKLTIKNSSSFDLELVHWIDNNSKPYYFTNSSTYDSGIDDYVDILESGTSVTQDVKPGNSYVYFYFINWYAEYHTTTSVSVSQGKTKTFTITDETSVATSSSETSMKCSEVLVKNKNLGPADLQEKKDEIAKFMNSNQ